MRIPHHLTRSSTGLWSFRQRVPADLHAVLGRRIIKRSLRTHDLRHAQAEALALMARYAHAFAMARDLPMDRINKKDVDALIEGLTKGSKRQELTVLRTRAVDGTIEERWQIDNETDARLYREAHGLSAAKEPPAVAPVSAQTVQPPTEPAGPVPAPVPPPAATAVRKVAEVMALGKARDAWLASLQGNTLPKTLTAKKTAIEFLVAFLGAKTKLHTITRPDLARWYQHMRMGGSATPTLGNKQSYIGGEGGFFEWAIASGYYPENENPACGHITYSVNEKRARRKLGFKPYDHKQIQTMFDPVAFEKLSAPARWAALIGLYTGARASEVGQLLVADVFKDGEILCIRISDDGEHQKVKTEVSLRTVPIHRDLLALGFEEWVDSQRAAGHERLFHRAKPDAKNGAGNWITKAFSRYLEQVGKKWPKASGAFTRSASRSFKNCNALVWHLICARKLSAMKLMTSIMEPMGWNLVRKKSSMAQGQRGQACMHWRIRWTSKACAPCCLSTAFD